MATVCKAQASEIASLKNTIEELKELMTDHITTTSKPTTLKNTAIITTTTPVTTTTIMTTTTTVYEPPVIFSIYGQAGGTTTAGNVISFTEYFVNIGNSMTSDTFNVPYTGLYEMSFFVSSYDMNSKIEVKKNGNVEFSIYSEKLSWANFGTTWLMNLNQNDSIQLFVSTGQIYSNTNVGKMFNGRRITHYQDRTIFSVMSNVGGSITAGNYIDFDQILVDGGNHFKENLGLFTVPRDATFEFSFSGNSYDTFTVVDVLKNDIKIISFSSSAKLYSVLGCTWILEMKKNDKLQLKVNTGSIYATASLYRIFNGIELSNNLDFEPEFFSAIRTNEVTFSTKSYLTFEKFLVSNDNFDLSKGELTTSVPGIYAFSMSMNVGSTHGTIRLCKNGDCDTIECYTNGQSWSSLRCNWKMQLTAGDKIRLNVDQGTIQTHEERNLIFNGKLLVPDLYLQKSMKNSNVTYQPVMTND